MRTALALHLTIEYIPALVYLTLIFILGWLPEVSVLGCTIVLIWKLYCIEILHGMGLVVPIFGMEPIIGFERGLIIGQEAMPLVTTLIKMQKPRNDLEVFRKRVLKHFQSFPRFRS